ncbi:tail fiber assembly protein [Pectobacterium phage PcCB7V]|nr:tail fiber assembly protein [Pectobacterium phage PcCB7V]
MRMNNFKHYNPEAKAFGEGVQYFCDDKGRDFYESFDLFTKKYVVLFDEFGMVRFLVKSVDISMTYPPGLSISDLNSIPKDFDIMKGPWMFDGKKITKVDFDLAIGTAKRKKAIMGSLSSQITPLADAVELGEATEEEIEKYNALLKLRIKLNRISDDAPAGEIDWSEFTAA